MDGGAKLSWEWMTQHMPRVVALMRGEREAGRGSQLNECWRAGVVRGEPGQFWASEGRVSVGTAPAGELVPAELLPLLQKFPGAAVLMLAGKLVGQDDGAQ